MLLTSSNFTDMNLSTFLNKYKENTYLIAEVSSKYNIQMTEDLRDVWDALKIAFKKYPAPTGSLLSSRGASKELNGELSHTILLKKASEGIFTLIDGKFQKNEILEFKKIIDLKNFFMKTKVILETRDHSNNQILAIIPTQVTKLGFSKLDQQLKANAMLLNDPFILAYSKILKNVSPETIDLVEQSAKTFENIHQKVVDNLKNTEN